MPLTKNGLTKACSGCRKTLSRQWRYFDGNNVPLDQRVYQIDDKPVPYQQLPGQSSTAVMGRSSSRGAPAENRADDELCYLCEKVISKDNLEILQTLPPEKNSKYVMYFPFIAKLRRPNGARPIDRDGRVLSCRRCYINLHHQWQTYDSEKVPIRHRKFVVREKNFTNE